MTHPLVDQLRFARSEFQRGLEGLSETDATKRIEAMNCISWNIGHLAWQEQLYWLRRAQGQLPLPEVHEQFAYGAVASTPALAEARKAWETITAAANPWLDTLTTEKLAEEITVRGNVKRTFGSMLLRTIYHYWYHNGENAAIRQALGHRGLPDFVGDIDTEAPYRPERAIQ